MERGGPAETGVWLELHTKKWVGKTGEVIVVYARVDKSSGDANLWCHRYDVFSALTFLSSVFFHLTLLSTDE